ncbi:MAG: ammonium transporter [Erysipelotrichaceae bacterium]|nr:ammonium transporter [Erysipelotrichaceae bacterium]MDD3810320.1 ammonium transporter [Erysipelotrichaceae bacterium]
MEQLINIVWVFLASVMVMLMQAGFAVLESGFTRSKNTNNVLMKNLMDFSIGSLIFYFIGFGLMFGSDSNGLFGSSGFINPVSLGLYADTLSPEVFIFFQTVFCATAATIVSGAMAERTKFSSYLIYTVVISLVVYPISGHWIWGGGFLSQMGFIDFAGSMAVHAVGGLAALAGAITIGPRIGKYTPDGKSNAILGHSIPLGALGVFILWFCWFGFNAGSSLEAATYVGHIAMTTNLAAAAAALATMFLTWFRYGKPDISMTLNGALAGLVAITAGCHIVSMPGAIIIGLVAGFLVTFGIEIIDQKFRIDDPVGAIGVHMLNGVWGTLAVGLFATDTPVVEGIRGLFYGGGLDQLIVQGIGAGAVIAWVLVTCFITFNVIKHTVGLRVTPEEEIRGLDIGEHGSEAYPEFTLKH